MDDSYIVRGYPTESAETMRAELKKAIDLAPGFPESYHLLAFVNLVTGEQLDDSISLLKRALTLSPARQDIRIMLAQVYLRKQDFKVARQILEQVVRSNSEPRAQAQAQSLLNSITSMEEQMARYKAADSSNGPRSIIAPRGEDKDAQPAPPADEKAAMQRALEDVLRKPRDGEEQARGLLLRIDCSVKGAVFSVKAGDRIFKLHSNDFAGIDFTTYTTEVNGSISCGPRNPANPVVITYRPVKDNVRRLTAKWSPSNSSRRILS